MNKKVNVLLLILIVTFIVLLAGCDDIALEESTNNAVDKHEDVEDTLNKLNNASTIKAKKSLFSLGDKWTIFVDNEEIGIVKGEPIYLIGDTYSLYTNNGSLVERESENLKIAKRSADIHSNEDAEVGYIEQSIVSLLMTFKLYRDDELKAVAKQKVGITLNVDIKDSEENIGYKARKKVISAGAELSLEKKDGDVNGLDALWMALIMNEAMGE